MHGNIECEDKEFNIYIALDTCDENEVSEGDLFPSRELKMQCRACIHAYFQAIKEARNLQRRGAAMASSPHILSTAPRMGTLNESGSFAIC